MTEPETRPLEWNPPRQAISRVPYLPGLDGMRALAVVAVMIYHANSGWLSGGFLGVEVFFVISGYLITLLLIGEHERTGGIDLRGFWMRRARRLLPALFTLLVGITIYAALFRRDALGQLRGDVIAALTYVSNWYQIWVGQGYTAAGDFAPLRHLWSLAVEEQFYVLWPLAMVGLIGLGRRRLPDISRWLFLAAVLISLLTAFLYQPGFIESCATTPEAYWQVAGRCISRTDFLYLSTPTRASGLLLGAAFAMVWRPVAVMRGPAREKGRVFDGIAAVGFVGLVVLCWRLHVVTPDGADPWLFRGGLFATGIATLFVIAGVTHRRTMTSRLLAIRPLVWIGTRSYGLYLYHWPIYQIMRKVSGRPLSLVQFVTALLLASCLTEISYRFIETPIRKGNVTRWWRRLQMSRDPAPRRVIAGAGAGLVALSVFAVTTMVTAELKPNEIAASLDDASDAVSSLDDLLVTTTVSTPAGPTTTSAARAGGALGPDGLPTTTTTPVPTTAAPTTTLPPPPPIIAIGDSVMLGAADELTADGVFVDAVVSRQMKAMIPEVQKLRDTGRLSNTVIVHLGTNGELSDETVQEFFTALSAVPKVLVLTISAPRGYVAGNNAKLMALPAQFPNVSVLYWDGLAKDCPGDCFYADGIHLRQAGQDYYTQLIMSQIAS